MITVGLWFFNRTAIIITRKKYPKDADALKRIFITLLSIIIGAFIVEWIVVGILYISGILLDMSLLSDDDGGGSIIITYLIAFTVIGMYESIFYFNKYIDSVKQRQELERAHVESQLQHLQEQLNPHFLFNSLNTLMSLIPMDSNKAMSYLGKLSTFYRYAVSNQQEVVIPLQKEIEHAELYLELLKERFGQSLEMSIKGEDVRDYYLFPMSLQLLIENAIKHNALSKESPLQMEIRIEPSSDRVIVTNNLQPRIEDVKTTGKGLKNLMDRYHYYNGSVINVQKTSDTFSVELPLIDKV